MNEYLKMLGKTVIVGDKITTLFAVGNQMLVLLDENGKMLITGVDECFLPEKFYSDKRKENLLIDIICENAGIKKSDFYKNSKTKLREYVQARQLHFFILVNFLKNSKTITEIGHIHGKSHATVLHSVAVVDKAINGFDIEFREKYKQVFELINTLFPDASKKINLKWL